MSFSCINFCRSSKRLFEEKVQVGIDQEKTQSEKKTEVETDAARQMVQIASKCFQAYVLKQASFIVFRSYAI